MSTGRHEYRYQGTCSGGPADGKFIAANYKNVDVPVPAVGGGFRPCKYQFANGFWLCQERGKDEEPAH